MTWYTEIWRLIIIIIKMNIYHFLVSPVSSIRRASDLLSRGCWFNPHLRCYFSWPVIVEKESNGYLYLWEYMIIDGIYVCLYYRKKASSPTQVIQPSQSPPQSVQHSPPAQSTQPRQNLHNHTTQQVSISSLKWLNIQLVLVYIEIIFSSIM